MLTIDRCDFFAGMGSPSWKDEKIERGDQLRTTGAGGRKVSRNGREGDSPVLRPGAPPFRGLMDELYLLSRIISDFRRVVWTIRRKTWSRCP